MAKRPKLKVVYNPQRAPGIPERVKVPRKTNIGGKFVPDTSKTPDDVIQVYNSVQVVLTSTDAMKKKVDVGGGKMQWRFVEGFKGRPTPLWFVKLYPSGEDVVLFDTSTIRPGDQLPSLYRKMRDAIKVALTDPNTGEINWKQPITDHIFTFSLEPVGNGTRTTYTFRYAGRVPGEKATVFTKGSAAPQTTTTSAPATPAITTKARALIAKPAPAAASAEPTWTADDAKLVAALNAVITEHLKAGSTIEQIANGDVRGTIVESLVEGLEIDGKMTRMERQKAEIVASDPSKHGLSLKLAA